LRIAARPKSASTIQALLGLFIFILPPGAQSAELTTLAITPSAADPTITRFDDPNEVVFDPDSPACSAAFRQKRVFGDALTNVIDNTPSESIVNRLTKLPLFLSRQDSNIPPGVKPRGDKPCTAARCGGLAT
jgi:hypothetical protein